MATPPRPPAPSPSTQQDAEQATRKSPGQRRSTERGVHTHRKNPGKRPHQGGGSR